VKNINKEIFMNFKIVNSLLLQDYLITIHLNECSINELECFFLGEGFKNVFVDLLIVNNRKYETSPCGRILMIGEGHLKNIIKITLNNLKVN
jgi:hypothetical protein